ncbi:MAG TPA: hypothetical protein DCZ12_17195 [Gammaproteobacteria bacterium]|nr:hypothetical protein [Gammaproteobacteria bacterium]
MSIRLTRLNGFAAKARSLPDFIYVRNSDDIHVLDASTLDTVKTHSTISAGNVNTGDPPSGLTVSPDGSMLLTSGALGVGVYDAYDGTELHFYSNTNDQRPAMSADGAYIAYAEGLGANTRIVETSGWTEYASFDPVLSSGEVYAFSNDGSKLAIGDQNGDFRIFNTSDQTAYSNALALSFSVRSIAFSPDDSEIAVGLRQNAVNQLNIMTVAASMTSESVAGVEIGDDITDVVYSPDGAVLYCFSGAQTTAAVERFSTSGYSSLGVLADDNLSQPLASGAVSEGGEIICYWTESGASDSGSTLTKNLDTLVNNASPPFAGGYAIAFSRCN